VFADPQVVHRGMRIDMPCPAAAKGSLPGLRTPITIDGARMASGRPSPRLGEHSREVLREIGMEPAPAAEPRAKRSVASG
jgi:crotonobetainyl-CoA:carnitine CoA-transferase CaiB-like acyl-CoA transferase